MRSIRRQVFSLSVDSLSVVSPSIALHLAPRPLPSLLFSPIISTPFPSQFKCSPTFQLPALAAYAYFEKRPPFSIMGLFRNPMLLMMLFSGGMMYMMPKMMEGMDDEQKEAMQKQMAMQSDPQAMLAELFGGGGDDEPVGGSKKSIGGGGGGGGGGGAKKRR